MKFVAFVILIGLTATGCQTSRVYRVKPNSLAVAKRTCIHGVEKYFVDLRQKNPKTLGFLCSQSQK